MKKFHLFACVTLVALAFSQVAGAYDFNQADALFAARDNNPANIASARKLYTAALTLTTGPDLIKAVERLSMLAYYEGDLLTPLTDYSARATIFTQCLDNVEKISPAKIGKEAGQYFYWKSVCLGLWGQAAGDWKAVWRVSELKDAMFKGLKVDSSYEGGGIHRVIASVYIKSKMMSLVGLYNPQAALEQINSAIAKGPDFFNAYLIKGLVLKELGQNDQALSVLTDAKERLEKKLTANALSADLVPEAKVYLRQINALMSTL